MSILPPIPPGEPSRAKGQLAVLILILAAASVACRLLYAGRLQQTSALFIGLPTLLALALASTPRAKSPIGIVLKGITIGLLMSGIVLGEGFVCILMAAPLFYVVGIAIGLVATFAERRARRGQTLCLVLVLLPASLEGTDPRLSFHRDEIVQDERIVDGTPERVRDALARTPRFDRPLPLYLRLGFPRPEEAAGAGLQPGAFRRVRFEADPHTSSELVMVVDSVAPGHVVFRVLWDTSMVSEWLDWRDATVDWRAEDDSHTRVTWTLRYARRLDPAWYFAPWERYATRLGAAYLIETAATPR